MGQESGQRVQIDQIKTKIQMSSDWMGIKQLYHQSWCSTPLFFGSFSIRTAVWIHQFCYWGCCGNQWVRMIRMVSFEIQVQSQDFFSLTPFLLYTPCMSYFGEYILYFPKLKHSISSCRCLNSCAFGNLIFFLSWKAQFQIHRVKLFLLYVIYQVR